MTNKDLKTVNIKGKEYVPVSERIKFFNEVYPNGSIVTELISSVESQNIVVKSTVTPDVKVPERIFTGYSQATVGDGYINKTSALENAETSAVGRALGIMGIGVIDSIASSNEIVKATTINDFPDMEKSNKAINTTHFCELHKKKLVERTEGVWDHRATLNDKKEFDPNGHWHYCQGGGWIICKTQDIKN